MSATAKSVLGLDEQFVDFSPTVKLSQRGLKTAEDVKIFLESPAGEAVIGEIATEIDKEKAAEDQRHRDTHEHDLLITRIKVFLLLFVLENEASASDKVKEIIAQQHEKTIQNAKAATAQPETARELEENAAESKQLTERLDSLSKEGEEIQAKNALFNTTKQEILNPSESTPEQFDREALTKHYQTQLNELNNYTTKFPDRAGDPKLQAEKVELESNIALLGDENAPMTKAQANIFALTTDINKQEAKSSKSPEVDPVAFAKLQNTNLKLEHWLNERDIETGKKYYANADGARVNSAKDAAFLLPNDKRVVIDNEGIPYLLNRGQDLESLNNPEVKAKAQKDFNKSRQDISSVVTLIDRHQESTVAVHKERVDNTVKALQANKKQKDEISNRANQQNGSNPLKLEPTPSYATQLEKLKQQKEVSFDDLHKLVEHAPPGNQKEATEFLNQQYNNPQNPNMQRSAPIPFQTMQSLLKNMERFGVDATKPGVTSIQNPEEKKNQAPGM